MKTVSLFASITALVCGVHVATAEELTMRPLFNGKDLTGWKGEGYAVEGGAIVCTPKGRNLITEETFANFVLDFEFQLTPVVESAAQTFAAQAHAKGVELCVGDADGVARTSTLGVGGCAAASSGGDQDVPPTQTRFVHWHRARDVGHVNLHLLAG